MRRVRMSKEVRFVYHDFLRTALSVLRIASKQRPIGSKPCAANKNIELRT